MNYRYKIQGEDIILSQQEHDVIQKQIRTGQHALVTLRQGRLGIDTSKTAFFKETVQPTDEEEQTRNETLKLNGAKYQEPTKEDIARRKKMMEDWIKKKKES